MLVIQPSLSHYGRVALFPLGCALSFSPGWEVDSSGGTAGLCQSVERDIYDCFVTCYWPAQVPDHLNNFPDWASKYATATKDWKNLDLVFPYIS